MCIIKIITGFLKILNIIVISNMMMMMISRGFHYIAVWVYAIVVTIIVITILSL